MKWVNIGDVEEFDYHTDAWETIKSNTSNTGKNGTILDKRPKP